MTEASKSYIKLRKLLPAAALAAAVASVGIYLWTHSASSDVVRTEQVQEAVIPEGIKSAVSTNGELPNEADFVQVAESETLVLLADKNTGHFKVRDKRDGHELRSYPNPEDWPRETISGTWRSHLLSPIMLETATSVRKTEVKVSSLLSLNGGIMSWKQLEDGFAVTYAMPSIQMAIPVEVRIKNDYVETKVIDSEIVEGKDALINLKVYPFLGAKQPGGQEEEYMFRRTARAPSTGSRKIFRTTAAYTANRSTARTTRSTRSTRTGGRLRCRSMALNREAAAFWPLRTKARNTDICSRRPQGCTASMPGLP